MTEDPRRREKEKPVILEFVVTKKSLEEPDRERDERRRRR